MTAATAVHVRAPGKINIALRVGSVQPDGYHPLVTVFQAVSLFEDVVARRGEGISLEVSGRSADLVPCDETNLAWRAAQLLADATGVAADVHLSISKGVPTAGGMAGGSADAAAALLACDLLWGTGLAREELGELAAELGADVPFALTGQTAVGVGRGDVLTPALARGRFTWVLALSDRGLSTPAVFAAWDERHAGEVTTPDLDPDLMHALVAGDAGALAHHLVNDLQEAALALRPELAEVLTAFEDSAALAAVVSGSGPTVAALADGPAAAAEIAAQIEDAGVASEVLVVTGPALGARLVEPVRGDTD